MVLRRGRGRGDGHEGGQREEGVHRAGLIVSFFRYRESAFLPRGAVVLLLVNN